MYKNIFGGEFNIGCDFSSDHSLPWPAELSRDAELVVLLWK